MNTSELIHVLKEHKRITKVELSKVKDCTEFWAEFASDVYAAIPSDDNNTDKIVGDLMVSFAESDSLELVNKAGKLLKRFSKFHKDSLGTKLPDSVVSIMGDKLQYFLSKNNSVYYVDFADSIDWQDGQFGKRGSCWFGTYADSVPTFENGGGWGIRFYADENQNNDNGIGRTWILPKDGILMCFNSYGVERANVSKVIKSIYANHGITLHYKAVEIINSNNSEIPYINGGTGFVLYPEGYAEELLNEYDVDLEVKEDEDHCTCDGCGQRISYDDAINIGDYTYCTDCTSKRFSFCDKCNEYCDNDEVHEIHGSSRYEYICRCCADSIGAYLCDDCGDYYVDAIVTDENNTYCKSCNESAYCESCNEWHEDGHICEDEEESESNSLLDSDSSSEFDYIQQEMETINYAGPRGNTELTTLVYRNINVNGLIVFQNNNTYSVTHETSGLYIKSDIDELYKAIELLNRLQGLTDWTQSADDIYRQPELIEVVINIRRDVVG